MTFLSSPEHFKFSGGSCPTHINREGNAIIPSHVFWVLFLCCSIFFFFLKRTQESGFFGDKTIYGQGSPVCIITAVTVFRVTAACPASPPQRTGHDGRRGWSFPQSAAPKGSAQPQGWSSVQASCSLGAQDLWSLDLAN